MSKTPKTTDEAGYNVEVAEWAERNAGTYPDLTEEQRIAFRQAVLNFGSKPGFTIGDVARALPYDEERALTVAITETTNMSAEAAEREGQRLKREWPDIPVIKTWFTNNDAHVCPICASLDGKEVEISKEFAPGINRPAAHDGCRCWMSVTTSIGEEYDEPSKPWYKRLFGREK